MRWPQSSCKLRPAKMASNVHSRKMLKTSSFKNRVFKENLIFPGTLTLSYRELGPFLHILTSLICQLDCNHLFVSFLVARLMSSLRVIPGIRTAAIFRCLTCHLDCNHLHFTCLTWHPDCGLRYLSYLALGLWSSLRVLPGTRTSYLTPRLQTF
ncbi:hypothetical protein XELAEV_18003424mg [Xenopus laevis]|uniref:Uncharacterized protein n=1 Tax=Xenopus laevis TaxID=8355 RepID=A0A974BPV3_XENLA|nr:hypothetical protein XELAEV_18003424mg [Xenopus laevis]